MPSITIVKRFTYRGNPEEFSNTYHFSGTVPADYAAWKALADAIITQEKAVVPADVSFVQAYGYVAGNELSVAQIDYTIPPNTVVVGVFTGSAGQKGSGDQAATTRWASSTFTSRGKRIYARKYWHPPYLEPANPDQLRSGYVTVLQAFAAKLIDGTLPGSFKYCLPQGAALAAPETSPYVTTRTLKRRGKRPPTS